MFVPCGRIDMVVVFLRAELAVSDPKLAGLIKEKLEINCLAGTENIVAGMSLRHFSIAWVCRLSGAKLSFEKQGRDQVSKKCVLLFIIHFVELITYRIQGRDQVTQYKYIYSATWFHRADARHPQPA